jgi:hypothetical protein
MESNMEGPQKIKNKTTVGFSDTTPGHIFKRMHSRIR